MECPTGFTAESVISMRGIRISLTPHLHVLLPEVLWKPSGEVVELPPPDDEEVEGVLRRLLLQLKAVLAQAGRAAGRRVRGAAGGLGAGPDGAG